MPGAAVRADRGLGRLVVARGPCGPGKCRGRGSGEGGCPGQQFPAWEFDDAS